MYVPVAADRSVNLSDRIQFSPSNVPQVCCDNIVHGTLSVGDTRSTEARSTNDVVVYINKCLKYMTVLCLLLSKKYNTTKFFWLFRMMRN